MIQLAQGPRHQSPRLEPSRLSPGSLAAGAPSADPSAGPEVYLLSPDVHLGDNGPQEPPDHRQRADRSQVSLVRVVQAPLEIFSLRELLRAAQQVSRWAPRPIRPVPPAPSPSGRARSCSMSTASSSISAAPVTSFVGTRCAGSPTRRRPGGASRMVWLLDLDGQDPVNRPVSRRAPGLPVHRADGAHAERELFALLSHKSREPRDHGRIHEVAAAAAVLHGQPGKRRSPVGDGRGPSTEGARAGARGAHGSSRDGEIEWDETSTAPLSAGRS
jgi:hypothetical protein